MCVKQMKKSGAILIGTNNLNEFASGITGKNPFYGDSKNPWNQERISGGIKWRLCCCSCNWHDIDIFGNRYWWFY